MSAKTGIAWTDTTWNPVTGCTKVSAGCKNCHAEAVANRWWKGRKFTEVRLHHERLDAPLRWRKPRRVFVNSMSDLFHKEVDDNFIDVVFAVMALATQHTFQVLTKRPERMLEYLRSETLTARGNTLCAGRGDCIAKAMHDIDPNVGSVAWPLPNVWLGVSCENQEAADERIPLLLETPAAVRFLSCEPLLGPIDLASYLPPRFAGDPSHWRRSVQVNGVARDGANWVIVGGESGPGFRPMQLEWAQSLREQCRAAGVPFFFKQNSGRWSGMGEDALGELVQEFPEGGR